MNYKEKIEEIKKDFTKKFGLNAYFWGEIQPSGKTENVSIDAIFDFFEPLLEQAQRDAVGDFEDWFENKTSSSNEYSSDDYYAVIKAIKQFYLNQTKEDSEIH